MDLLAIDNDYHLQKIASGKSEQRGQQITY